MAATSETATPSPTTLMTSTNTGAEPRAIG